MCVCFFSFAPLSVRISLILFVPFDFITVCKLQLLLSLHQTMKHLRKSLARMTSGMADPFHLGTPYEHVSIRRNLMTFWNHILMKIGCAFGFMNRTISMSLIASNSLTRISYTLAGRWWQQQRRMRCTFIFFSFPHCLLSWKWKTTFLCLRFSGAYVVWYFF